MSDTYQVHWLDEDGDHNVELTVRNFRPQDFGDFAKDIHYSESHLMALAFGVGMAQLRYIRDLGNTGFTRGMVMDTFVRWARDYYHNAELVQAEPPF